MMVNLGKGKFAEVAQALGIDGIEDARGFVASDFDHDGDVDLIVNNYRSRAHYYVNQFTGDNNFIAVKAQGTTSNRDAVGAEITVVIGDQRLMRLVGAGHAYTGQFSLEQTIGVGQAEKIDNVEVRWPDGQSELFGPQGVNERITLVQGQGKVVQAPKPRVSARKDESLKDKESWAGWIGAGVVVLLGLGLLLKRRD